MKFLRVVYCNGEGGAHVNLMHAAHVTLVHGVGVPQLCPRDKEVSTMYDLYQTRNRLGAPLEQAWPIPALFILLLGLSLPFVSSPSLLFPVSVSLCFQSPSACLPAQDLQHYRAHDCGGVN